VSNWKSRAIPAAPVEPDPSAVPGWKARALPEGEVPAPGPEGATPTQAKPDTDLPGFLETTGRAFFEGYTGGLSGRLAGVGGVLEELGERAGALTYPDGVPQRPSVPLGYAFDEARQQAEARRWTGDQGPYAAASVGAEVAGGVLNPVAAVIGRAAPIARMLPAGVKTALQVPRKGVEAGLKGAVTLADQVVVPGAVAGGMMAYGKGEAEDVPTGMAFGGGLSLGLVGGVKAGGALIDLSRVGAARMAPEASKAVADWLRQRAINRYKKGAGAIQQDLAIDPKAREREDMLTGLLLDAEVAKPGDTPETLLPKFQEMAEREGAAQGGLERATDDAMGGRVGLESGDLASIRAERMARRSAAREASEDALLQQQTRLGMAFQSARRRLEGELQELEGRHAELVKQLDESVSAANASGEAYSGQLQAEQAALEQQLAAVENAARQRVEQIKQVAAQQQEALAQTITSSQQQAEAATAAARIGTQADLSKQAATVDVQKRLLAQKLANTLDALEGNRPWTLSPDDQVAAGVGAIPRETLITLPFRRNQVQGLGGLMGKPDAEKAKGVEALAMELIVKGDSRAATVGRLLEDEAARALVVTSGKARNKAVEELARVRSPAVAPALPEDLQRIAALPPKERKAALAQLAQQMADLEVSPTATEGIQPEVLQLMGAGKRERASALTSLAETRVPRPPPLEQELEAVRGLAPDQRKAVLEDIARRRLAAQEGVDPALAPVVGKASKEQKPAIEGALNQRIMYPEPKAPPVPPDDVLLHNVGLDVEPVVARLNEMLADYRSHDDRGNAAYILNTIRTLRQNARKGMTAAELRGWKTSITENLNYAKDANKTQAMKKAVAGIYDDAVEDAVLGQLGPEKLAEYQKTKDAFGAASMATNWATRGTRRELGNRAISPSDYATGATAALAGEGLSGKAKAALAVVGAAANNKLRKQSMSVAIYSDRLSKYLRAGAEAGPASSAMFNEYGWFLKDMSRATPASAAVGYYLMHTRDQKFREMDEEAQKELATQSR